MEALSSRASSSTNSTPSVTVNPAATGTNQLPGWIQSQLQSGEISEYTNPNTNQTFYAPHTVNNSNQIWVSGPGGAGPINQTVGGQSIQVTSPTATISQGNNVIYTGSSSHAPSLNFTPKGAFQGFGKVQSSTPTTPLALNTPAVDYATFGNSAQINWVDPNLGTYYLTLSLPNRETFNYGSKTNPMQVYGVILGSQEAKDAAVDAAWNAYINGATQALNSQGSGSTATTLQGSNGLTLSVTPGANTYGSYSPSPKTSYQSVLIAPGYSLSLPTTLESGGVSVNVNWAQNPSGGFTPNPVSYQFSDGSQTTTVNPQSSGALKSIEALGYSAAQAQSLLNSAGTQPLTFNIDSATGAISGNVGALSSTSPLFNVNYSAMPITAPTFSTSSGTPNIILPQGWSTDSSGNLYVNGNAPTLQQSEQYANAYAGYLNWYQANSPSSTSSSTNQATTPPPVPNWYTTLSQSSSPSSGIYSANLAALQYAPLAPTITSQAPIQKAEKWLGQNIVSPVESALSPVETELNNYIAKPFEQYVASPVEQAASYAASQLSPAPSTPSKSVLPQQNPLTTGMFPSELLVNELTSSLQPYITNGSQDINNFLSGLQNGINQWATTSYNPNNILSAPYWENTVGSSIKTIEQFIGHPLQTVGAIPGEMAQVQSLANQLVKEGAAPWYLPDVTMAMMAAPLVATGYGGVALTGGSLGAAGTLTGIGAGANYGINGLLRGQWTGPQAFQNAETGALTSAIMSPLTVSSPIADLLASRGITGLTGQILNNIPVYGSWSALNAGLSSEAQGSVPTPAYLAENFGTGAAMGVAMPLISFGLSNVGFRLPSYTPDEASPDTSARALTFRFFGKDYPLISKISEGGDVTYNLLNAGQFSTAQATAVETAANNMNKITTDFANQVVQNTLKNAVDSGEITQDVADHYIETLNTVKGTLTESLHIPKPSEVNLHMDKSLYTPEEIAKMNEAIQAISKKFGVYGTSTVGINLNDVFAQAGQDLFRGAHDIDIQTLPLSSADPAEAAQEIAQIMGPDYHVSPDNPDVVERILDGQKVFDIHGSAAVPGEQPAEIPKTEFGLSHKNYINIDGIKVAPLYNTILDKAFSSLAPRINPETGEFEIAPAAARSTMIKSDLADLYAIERAVIVASGGDPSSIDAQAARAIKIGFMPEGAYENAVNDPNILNIAYQQLVLATEGEGLSMTPPYPVVSPSTSYYQYLRNSYNTASPSMTNSLYSTSPSVAMSTSPSVTKSVSPTISSSAHQSTSSSTYPSVAQSVSTSSAESVSPSVSYSTSPSISVSSPTSPSVALSSYSSVQSPSLPPSPPSTPPPKKLPRIPNLPTLPQWFSAQEAALASMPAPQYTAQYSPSLLALLSPEINKLALQNYSPLQALSGVRPIMPSNPATYNYYNNHPTQALTAIENVPGTPNYQSAQSAPARAIMPTYAQSANPLRSTFSSAPASSQVSAVIDPATLQKVMNAAYPISLGSLPAGTQGGIFTQNNALLNSLKNLNQNELANYLAKTTPEQPQQSQFASAPFKMPTINGISIMPSAQDIISALGVKQTLSLLSKINPVKFNIANLEKATPAELANALQNLSYSDITLLMAEMPMMDRIQVYMLLGIPYAEAYLLAQNVNPQMFPTLSNALAGTTRKRIISAPSAEPELARAITI
jgi:hypothetical protein